jgi:hypothetical protein
MAAMNMARSPLARGDANAGIFTPSPGQGGKPGAGAGAASSSSPFLLNAEEAATRYRLLVSLMNMHGVDRPLVPGDPGYADFMRVLHFEGLPERYKGSRAAAAAKVGGGDRWGNDGGDETEGWGARDLTGAFVGVGAPAAASRRAWH